MTTWTKKCLIHFAVHVAVGAVNRDDKTIVVSLATVVEGNGDCGGTSYREKTEFG